MRAVLFKKTYLPNVQMLFPTVGGACLNSGLPDNSGHTLGVTWGLPASPLPCTLHCEAQHWCQYHYDTIRVGSSCGMFCIMDACPATDLPPSVRVTRVPEWLLPDEWTA